ncbi:putative hydrogen peroxide-inducible genes activator [Arthrobacter saudimassiliensis]|uniref:Putative hydrogen peroxide-inducible genes activator n=1 Tax=Arthrobacter saudimassiliensis TaxID=1461584 RepID=A0A078MSB7_9MICC|nr:putative hydrogen peroxide-inducible genes activator [Arthrobacter saudimassiliensis]
MLNPVHLKTLLEVIRVGSFAGAAARLGYTPSAVSQQMSALERETGTRLFVRTARTAVATEAAEVIARHAAKVLTDMDALMAAAARADAAEAHELRLGIFPSLATFALPRLLGTPEWKGLGIDLRTFVAEPAQTIHGLRGGGELDVALIYQVGQSGLAWPATINRQWVGDDDFRVVLPASWGIRSGAEVSPEQLSGMPWIMHHPGTPDAVVIERLLAGCSLHPRISAYCDDFNASLAMVRAGVGAALVPELAMLAEPEGAAADGGPAAGGRAEAGARDGVVVIEVPEIRLARNIFALVPTDRENARVRVFLDLLSRVLKSASITRRSA